MEALGNLRAQGSGGVGSLTKILGLLRLKAELVIKDPTKKNTGLQEQEHARTPPPQPQDTRHTNRIGLGTPSIRRGCKRLCDVGAIVVATRPRPRDLKIDPALEEVESLCDESSTLNPRP